MKVLLTKQAENNYRSIKEYISVEWGDKVTSAFEQKIIDFLELLEKFPEIGIVEVQKKESEVFL